PEVLTALREKDIEISELRLQLDDKDRMVAALRSAARQREVAQLTPDAAPQEAADGPKHQSNGSNASSLASTGILNPVSPVAVLAPLKPTAEEGDEEKQRIEKEKERER